MKPSPCPRAPHARAAAGWARGPMLLALVLLGCSRADTQPAARHAAAQAAPPAEAACAPGDTALFPTARLRERAIWYGSHLRAAGEGRLCERGDADEVYRFTWLRSFHATIVVRVERRGARHTLTAKRLSGEGGYEPGHLVVNRTTPLGAAEWAQLHALLDSAAFWSPPATSGAPKSGLDGSRWILEGVQGNRYHAVDLWSPDETGPGRHVRALGLHLLRLARLMPRSPDDVY